MPPHTHKMVWTATPQFSQKCCQSRVPRTLYETREIRRFFLAAPRTSHDGAMQQSSALIFFFLSASFACCSHKDIHLMVSKPKHYSNGGKGRVDGWKASNLDHRHIDAEH